MANTKKKQVGKAKKVLRRYDVCESVFDDILQTMESSIEIVDDISDYFTGYQPKHKIYYDNKEYLIIREHLLAYFADFSDEDYQNVEDWRQVIVRKAEQPQTYQKSIDGSRAYKEVKRILLQYYTEEEFDQQLKAHSAKYDEKNKQYHSLYVTDDNIVLQHSNCVKYDINGAHHDALIEIFPRAEKELRALFTRRKEEPILKAYVNYFVGMLCRKGYRGTFNWIVQRTRKMLLKAINEVEGTTGTLIYANTDGFMVSNPEHKLEHSTELGKFKLEFEGTAYTYKDENYTCYQTDTGEIKGNIRYSVRDQLNLKKGEVVHYDISRETLPNGTIVNLVKNVVKEHINVYKEN